jgi:micrococcal nuclease
VAVRALPPHPVARVGVRAALAALGALAGAALALVALAGCGDAAPGRPGDALEANAVVRRIVDGDTLVVDTGGVDERVRLIGIDTPESVDPRRPVMCFGKEAAAHLERLVPPGTPVRLERDVEARDRYDRLLAYLFRASDGRFVNLAMVEDGFAQQYTYPPNVRHDRAFGEATRAARSRGVGLWSACPEPFER